MNPDVRPGDRIIAIGCNDPWTSLPAGLCGTVSFVDDAGTVFADWDNGTRLGLIGLDGDLYELVDPSLPCGHESRGGSRCSRQQGHTGHPDPETRLHCDLTILWDAAGYLCNLDGVRL